MQDARKKQLGAVYTPQLLAQWASALLFRFLPGIRPLILDPACGDGVLLKAATERKIDAQLVGVDIDRATVSKARGKLVSNARILRADALLPSPAAKLLEGWAGILGGRLVDGLIANPPWGGTIRHSTSCLSKAGYSLAKGQFDTYDLFVELALQITRRGGVCVFIIPDSIFLPEHKALRELLLQRTQILMIARLGEGFFSGVYRGVVVLVIKNLKARKEHCATCLRLPKAWRSDIISGIATLHQAEKQLSHRVPQKRFAEDPFCRFDIDLSQNERAPMVKMDQYVNGWTDWLQTGRGVELSKGGQIFVCPECDQGFPAFRDEGKRKCPSCGSFIDLDKSRRTIVLPIKDAPVKWKPLIVGEDVDRMFVEPSRRIRLGVKGINYKDESLFDGPKLLIRKTGVGLNVARDESGAFTNQVVFIYKPKASLRPPDFILWYFLGVLSSRVMLAYHLKRSGDNEWRSHPYITQRTISELPVPNVQPGTWGWQQAKAIAAAARRTSAHYSTEADLHLEGLVAGMYGLTEADCRWVGDVLNRAQSLEAIRRLRLLGTKSFGPIIA